MDEETSLRLMIEWERDHQIREKRELAFGSAQGLMACTFDHDKGGMPQLEHARRYVDRWPEVYQEDMGLLFWGPAGTGKTFAAACIANALIDRGVEVRMITLGKALLDLFGMSGAERIQYLDDLTTCRLLIVDDLGVERRTSYAREQVYEIIDRRYLSGQPMIVTTNLTLNELKHAGRDDGRIHSRILERCVPVCFNGPDLRRENAAQMLRRARELLGADDAAAAD